MGETCGQDGLVPRLRFPEFRWGPEWRQELLGELCEPKQWTTISRTDLTESGFPVYGANGQIGFYSEYNHEHEVIAVSCRGANCGEVNLVPAMSYVTGNSMCLEDIDPSRISYEYLYQALKHADFGDVITGTAQPQIVGHAIRKLPVAVPGIQEQCRIAGCLGALDALISGEMEKLGSLKRFKRGLMERLFPVGIRREL